MNKLYEVLSKQIVVAESLLQHAKNIPDGERSMFLAGYIQYDERLTQPLAKEVEAWQIETKEILIVLYGENARQVSEFERNIKDKSHYFKFREGIQSELQDCISELKAFIKADALKRTIVGQDKEQPIGVIKRPLVFISHSSKDLEFVKALVTLLESMGFDNKNLFCSSIPDYWIGLSKDVFASLRQLFVDRELYVIFVQSPRFYESAVSLNEMGAAWVLQTGYCSILTKDMQKEQMCGVFDDRTIFLKVDAPEVEARMNELRDLLVSKFGLPEMSHTTWERKRNAFLKTVNEIDCTSDSVKSEKEINSISEEYLTLQISRLKQEAIEMKQAKIRGNIISSRTTGNRILKIFNAGQSIAKNVNVEWLNPSGGVLFKKKLGVIGDITPQNGRSYDISLIDGHDEENVICVTKSSRVV